MMNRLMDALCERGYKAEDVYFKVDPNYETILEVYSIATDSWVGEWDTEDKCWVDEEVDYDDYRESYNDYISSYIY